jgi:hypothetical protein
MQDIHAIKTAARDFVIMLFRAIIVHNSPVQPEQQAFFHQREIIIIWALPRWLLLSIAFMMFPYVLIVVQCLQVVWYE